VTWSTRDITPSSFRTVTRGEHT